MKAFFIGAMIGFLMCIPIGPLNVIVINTHIKRGFKRAMCIALGGSFMDFVYFFLILSGLSFLHFSDTSLSFFKTAGILLIFGLGLKEILSQPKLEREVQINDSASKLVGSFIFGVVIYTSNPTLVLTMSGLGTFTKSLQAFEATLPNHVFASLGVAIGSVLWFLCLLILIGRFEAKIKTRYLPLFNRVSGFLMLGLSLYMGLRLIHGRVNFF